MLSVLNAQISLDKFNAYYSLYVLSERPFVVSLKLLVNVHYITILFSIIIWINGQQTVGHYPTVGLLTFFAFWYNTYS